MKVLVIEDDSKITQALVVIFRIKWPEASVLTTTAGERGIELARDESPDIIILDLGLPDIDGLQVICKVRDFSNVPIIILSAQGEETYKLKGLELGADDYMTKPFSPGELLARVKTVTRRFEAAGEKDKNVQRPFTLDNLHIDSKSHEVTIDGKPLRLGPRPYDLLYQLLADRGKFVPVETLMKAVAAPGEELDEGLVTFLVNKLNDQLQEETGIPKMIIGERGKGYKLSVS